MIDSLAYSRLQGFSRGLSCALRAGLGLPAALDGLRKPRVVPEDPEWNEATLTRTTNRFTHPPGAAAPFRR